MADISQIKLPSGTTYNIKDAVARAAHAGGVKILGVTTTALTDGSTATKITIGGEQVDAVNGGLAFYGDKEFVYTTSDNKWHEFGDLSTLGALAQKDSASGSFTPRGTNSAPAFTGTEGNVSVSGTPAGTISAKASATGNYQPSGSCSAPAFTGTEGNVSVSGTAAGTISAKASATGNYTPAGSVSAPTISVASAGATASVTPIKSVGTLPELSTTVTNEVLEISFSQGTLPEKDTAVTVKTGDAAYSASAPSFTGTKVQLDFTGSANTSTGKFTPAGSVAAPTFTGNKAQLNFTGSSMQSTGKFTPAGSVAAPAFTGTAGTVTVS